MRSNGRPKQDEYTLLSERVIIRFTKSDRAALQAIASASGFSSLSDYIRETSLRRPSSTRQPLGAAGVLSADDRRALIALGNNLNQIAHRLNAGGEPDRVTFSLEPTLAALNTIFDRYLSK